MCVHQVPKRSAFIIHRKRANKNIAKIKGKSLRNKGLEMKKN